jgi:cytoskeletal protein CcmA (bactofilin family)
MLNRLSQGPSPFDTGRRGTPVTLLTVTGQVAKLQGRFVIADSLHVECEIGGELIVGGQLVIGEKGEVRADVRTVDAVVHGLYEGNLVASGTVEIMATGRVTGNIETDSLVISKGGFFNGNVVKSHAAPVTAEPGQQRLAAAV